MDCDSFQSSGLVVVEVEVFLQPREHELYDGAFPVDVFQSFWSMCFEVFGYSESVVAVGFVVGCQQSVDVSRRL